MNFISKSIISVFRFDYELVVVPGLVLNDSITPIIKTIAKEPPLFINPPDLGGANAAGKTFTMGIRARSAKVISKNKGKKIQIRN